MDDDRGGLSPYFPAETPALRGNGRRWAAILVAVLVLGGFLVGFVMAFLPG